MSERKSVGSSSTSTNVALEQNLVLASSTKGLALVEVIKQVLSNPYIFAFGDFLAIPNVKQLDGTEHAPYLRVLQLFAYGVYSEYKAAQATYPALTAEQLTKLRQLSIVTYASQHKELTYAKLMQELDVGSVRELEDLIIECVYQGLIFARLDQQRGVVEVQYASSRDIGPADLDQMLTKLSEWKLQTDKLADLLTRKIIEANVVRERKAKEAAAFDNQLAEKTAEVIAKIEAGEGPQFDEDPHRRGGKRGPGRRMGGLMQGFGDAFSAMMFR